MAHNYAAERHDAANHRPGTTPPDPSGIPNGIGGLRVSVLTEREKPGLIGMARPGACKAKQTAGCAEMGVRLPRLLSLREHIGVLR